MKTATNRYFCRWETRATGGRGGAANTSHVGDGSLSAYEPQAVHPPSRAPQDLIGKHTSGESNIEITHIETYKYKPL